MTSRPKQAVAPIEQPYCPRFVAGLDRASVDFADVVVPLHVGKPSLKVVRATEPTLLLIADDDSAKTIRRLQKDVRWLEGR